MDQQELTDRNRIAWSADAYAAWVTRYGPPATAAATIQADPTYTLRRLFKPLGDPANKKIANPLGSHGRVATALALLGAQVTVFDVSSANQSYALELAQSAGVTINYRVGDFLEAPANFTNKFDAAVMELGITHYFADIGEFADALRSILKTGGTLVLNEFHPLLKKSVELGSRQAKVTGDYFETKFEEAPTPYDSFVDGAVPPCLIRRWTLGEIVTGFVAHNFQLEQLTEHPAEEYPQLPGTFTLVARAI